MSGSAMWYLITQVRLQNPEAHIVVVDPHLSDTAVGVANQWLPIRPGTDSALVAGMIHYLFTQGKLDEALIREKFVGFLLRLVRRRRQAGRARRRAFMGMDKSGALAITEDLSYEAYLKGAGGYEGTGEKTPNGRPPSPASRRFHPRAGRPVRRRPDGHHPRLGPAAPQQRRQQLARHRMIAAITGNVGISGGGTGAREATGGVSYAVPTAIPCFPEKNTVDVCVSFFDWYQAIEDYKVMNDATWGIRHIDETAPPATPRSPAPSRSRPPSSSSGTTPATS